VATLDPFFGTHDGDLKVYVSGFPIGEGTFQSFTHFKANFLGSYRTFFQVNPLHLVINLTDQKADAASGPCEIGVNNDVDSTATYHASAEKITFQTKLAPSPIDVYRSQGGTQIDGINGHNAWIGEVSATGLIRQAVSDLHKGADPASAMITDALRSERPSATVLRGDGSFKFTAAVVGDDIVVSSVVATWFGGSDDPSDNGKTASGISTRDNPGIIGCALPMDGFNTPKTDGSPIPRLPWLTSVKVKNLKTNVEQICPLVDLGPSKFAASNAAIDLTKAAFIAIGGDPNAGVLRVDYVIAGAARQMPTRTGDSVSLSQSEANPSAFVILPQDDTAHGMSHNIPKPQVKFIKSPNFSSRNGTAIDMIVMHFTDGPSAQGAINRFLNPAEQVSAHYIIDRDGTIYQMVQDDDKAWHAKAANARSIGIEHVAMPGQQMSQKQTVASVALLRWLMATYRIKLAGITGHRFAPGNLGTTDCPDHLFGDATKQAIIDWVNIHFPEEVA
jgi:N-acetylmuramoyl-L-alanine amidase